MATKVGILSDTHGSIPKAVYQALSEASIILHAGDYHDPIRIESLEWRENGPLPLVLAVRGNCDWDDTFPSERYFDIEHVRFYLCHGHSFVYESAPWDTAIKNSVECAKALGLSALPANIIVFGHLHKKMDFYHQGVRFINPGSATRPRSGTPSLVILTIDNGTVTNTDWRSFAR